MVPTRAMTPHAPLTADEIVEQVLHCAELGAAMIHLHARDANGQPTYEKEVYARIIGGIREQREDLVLCVSTSGRTHTEFWQRSQVLELDGDLKPDFASLTLSSLNFAREASMNAPDLVRDLAAKMLERGIRPELECFEVGMINVARYLIDRELVRPPFYFNLILGNLSGAQAHPLSLGAMTSELPAGATLSVGGLGAAQLPATAMALAAGGGVRVGLEDNLWLDEARSELATNAALVERTVAL
ncbi:MAG: 3-keto-5-aminohexanoate cleavage protein, partial [candidate division WS1 bacterium]|nr:3-keto-5-aminohexanoate cleavage protein [candidate division WS1 bacterium]